MKAGSIFFVIAIAACGGGKKSAEAPKDEGRVKTLEGELAKAKEDLKKERDAAEALRKSEGEKADEAKKLQDKLAQVVGQAGEVTKHRRDHRVFRIGVAHVNGGGIRKTLDSHHYVFVFVEIDVRVGQSCVDPWRHEYQFFWNCGSHFSQLESRRDRHCGTRAVAEKEPVCRQFRRGNNIDDLIQPDWIWMLPVLSGLEVCKTLRARGRR